ncbi:MAG: LON peptidase substrate-binding domain-containing protein, partial [Candidatus Ornithomonoglobus sp.]
MEKYTHVFPTVAMRGIVVFPYMQLNFDIARPASIKAIEDAMRDNSRIFLVTQRRPDKEDNITPDDLYRVGTIAVIKQVMHLPGNVTRLIVKGLSRGIIRSYVQESPSFVCEVEEVNETYSGLSDREEAYCRAIKKKVEEYFGVSTKVAADRFLSIMAIRHLGQLCDTVAGIIDFDQEVKQSLLNELDYCERASAILSGLEHIIKVTEIEQSIIRKTKERMNEHQREYFLREQLEVIQEELGDKDGIGAEADEFMQKLSELGLPQETDEKLTKDISRYSRLPAAGSDSAVLRTYIETVLDLPWKARTEERFDVKKAEKILEEDHYGLEKVKERILEFLAVRQMTNGKNSTVLCLEGPPGVGKTSIAKSVARALDRKFVRVSLGGIHDESDIRGHRKTYIGAMEGRIMAAMREVKVRNPVMLLDEIDKMGADYKGDPSAALLEVLDNEQNNEFRDHYIEVPFDLSEVLFITTANTLDTISKPLLDR